MKEQVVLHVYRVSSGFPRKFVKFVPVPMQYLADITSILLSSEIEEDNNGKTFWCIDRENFRYKQESVFFNNMLRGLKIDAIDGELRYFITSA